MEPDPEFPRYYLASIILRSDAYEARLNEQILGALRDSLSTPEIASPAILAGPPNRLYFIESFLAGLFWLPFAVEILTPEVEVEYQIGRYEDGLPDPGNPGGLWRAMLLDIRLELGGARAAKIFLRELPTEDLVHISFTFDFAKVMGGRQEDGAPPASDLPRLREFLLALTEAYPVLVGTLGFDFDALHAGMPDNRYWRENRMSFSQLAGVLRQPDSDQNFDFVIIDSVVTGGKKPFVHDGIEPRQSFQNGEVGGAYHDLWLVAEIAHQIELAEAAYGRMYESKYPKDDRDDALGFLAKAITQAASLGLVGVEVELKQRYEHINEVFKSQFRK